MPVVAAANLCYVPALPSVGRGCADVGSKVGRARLESDLAFGDFKIDAADERVIGPAGPLKLGNKAYSVLLRLTRAGGHRERAADKGPFGRRGPPRDTL